MACLTKGFLPHSNAAIDIFPSLPFETIQQHKDYVEAEIQKRWNDVLLKKPNFTLYTEGKSEDEILKEFKALHDFRLSLWYRNPEKSPHICQQDYQVSQAILQKGYYCDIRNIAFAYNCTDNSYNASTVLIEGHHFIALGEPHPETLELFFTFLINHHVNILVRLKPQSEFTTQYNVRYWENRLSYQPTMLKLSVTRHGVSSDPVYIPYFFTETWPDDQAQDIASFYKLVQDVRQAYSKMDPKGPIAGHCASGVGRTGTFIAGMVLAEMIDRGEREHLSIEKLVLQLSIQRPNLMGTAKQYIMLYRFVDYYLKMQNLTLK